MSTPAFLDIKGLMAFKNAQDAYNKTHFVEVDPATGYIDSSKLPPNEGDVIEVHVDYEDPDNPTFYADVNGNPSQTPVTPEKGKLYVDIGSGQNKIWRWSGAQWIEMTSSTSSTDADIISDAEIQALFATAAGSGE